MNYRNRKLLDVTHDDAVPCCLLVPNVCSGDKHSRVPAHSNLQRHGRGFSLKSHDCFAIASCIDCHAWLDNGPADRAAKQTAFEAGLLRYWLWLLVNQRVVWPSSDDERTPEQFELDLLSGWRDGTITLNVRGSAPPYPARTVDEEGNREPVTRVMTGR